MIGIGVTASGLTVGKRDWAKLWILPRQVGIYSQRAEGKPEPG